MIRGWRNTLWSVLLCATGAVAAFVAVVPSNTEAHWRYTMASSCVSANTPTKPEGTYESNGAINNWHTGATEDVDLACPLRTEEDVSTADEFAILVYVRNNHSTDDIACQAVQTTSAGTNSWETAVTPGGSGAQTMTMPSSGLYSRTQALVSLYCKIPEKDSASASGVVGYKATFF